MELEKEKECFFIPGFENYVYDTKKGIVKNFSTNTIIQPLKTSTIIKYKLSKNGMNHYRTQWQILLLIFSKNFKLN
jgi:hypothetical protein